MNEIVVFGISLPGWLPYVLVLGAGAIVIGFMASAGSSGKDE